MTTIDIHAHFVDRHYVDDLARVMRLDAEQTADGKTLLRERGATIAWTRPDMFQVEHRLADMAQKNIDMRVLSVSAPNVYPWPVTEQVEIARHVNDALSRYCRAHPKKFIGLASLPLATSAPLSAKSTVPFMSSVSRVWRLDQTSAGWHSMTRASSRCGRKSMPCASPWWNIPRFRGIPPTWANSSFRCASG